MDTINLTSGKDIFNYLLLGTTSPCDLKLFRNTVALEKDDEQVNFINMRIKALWECCDEDEEVGAKHIADTERFQTTSCEHVPSLAGELGELIELDDELVENPTIGSLTRVITMHKIWMRVLKRTMRKTMKTPLLLCK